MQTLPPLQALQEPILLLGRVYFRGQGLPRGATDGVVCGTRQVAKQLLQSAVRAYKGTRGAAAGSGMLETVAVEAGAEGTQPSVVLVGDTHGQLHDLLHILSEAGACVKR
jgi:hypothetical protein